MSNSAIKKEIFNLFIRTGISKIKASGLSNSLHIITNSFDLKQPQQMEAAWQKVIADFIKPEMDYKIQKSAHEFIFKDWNVAENGLPPVVIPTQKQIEETTISQEIKRLGLKDEQQYYDYSISDGRKFWLENFKAVGLESGIKNNFVLTEQTVVDASDPRDCKWLKGAKLNIADIILHNAKQNPNDVALIYKKENRNEVEKYTYKQIDEMSSQFANALVEKGCKAGDYIGLYTNETNPETLAAYLGIMKMGGTVVNILASLQPKALEMVNKQIPGGLKCIVAQDYGDKVKDSQKYGQEFLKLYQNLQASNLNIPAIVIEDDDLPKLQKSAGDISFKDFTKDKNKNFESVARDADDDVMILFSSGSKGSPKGIVWKVEAFLKTAIDARLMHDVKHKSIFSWVTKPGWMMFSHLVAGGLMNKATIAAYEGDVGKRKFGEFLNDVGVQVVGIVPDIVDAWRKTGAMAGLAFDNVKRWCSTSKAMNPETCFFMLSLNKFKAGFNNYIGGSELFGGFMGCSAIKKIALSAYNMIAYGTKIRLVPDAENPNEMDEIKIVASNQGGYVTPPCSRKLINEENYGKTHLQTYYPNAEVSEGTFDREHGDVVRFLGNNRISGVIKDVKGFLVRTVGRDIINKGGVKVGNAELEGYIDNGAEELGYKDLIKELAVVGVMPPAKYNKEDDDTVVYVVLNQDKVKNFEAARATLQKKFSDAIKEYNPKVSKIEDVIFLDALPRDGKVKYGLLKQQYLENYDDNISSRPDPNNAVELKKLAASL